MNNIQPKRGKYIVVEGGDNSGKSSLVRRLAHNASNGSPGLDPMHVVREPGGTPFAEEIRSVLMSQTIDRSAEAEIFAFAAARADLKDKVIKPKVQSGVNVISDRSWISSYAYQAAQGANKELIADVNRIAMGNFFLPDLCIVLDADPLDLSDRDEEVQRYETLGLEFKLLVRDFTLEAVETYLEDRAVIIDAMLPAQEVCRISTELIEELTFN